MEIMASDVLCIFISPICKIVYCTRSIMLGKSQDISIEEQMTVCLKYVFKDFLGLYNVPLTDSFTFFDAVQNILRRLNISFSNFCDQCFDGAANTFRSISRLKKIKKEKESSAIYVTHVLNLAVKYTLENILVVRNFLNTFRELITFLRSSPKGLSKFRNIL